MRTQITLSAIITMTRLRCNMNNWIPCGKQLPDFGQQVLAFRPNTNHFYPKYGDPVHICLRFVTNPYFYLNI